MTFLIDQDGVVFQKDLGPKTARAADASTRFDQGPELGSGEYQRGVIDRCQAWLGYRWLMLI